MQGFKKQKGRLSGGTNGLDSNAGRICVVLWTGWAHQQGHGSRQGKLNLIAT
jgi:hypothetical protein